MRVLVCGDRHWADKDKIREVLSSVPNLEAVIEGEAKGADTLAREVAEELGVPVLPFPANWVRYGRAAGPIRNRQMLGGKPDLVIAFHNNIGESRGTKNMLGLAKDAGIPTRLCTSSSSSAGVGLPRDEQYEPPGYESVGFGSRCVEGDYFSNLRSKAIDIAPLRDEIPNYREIIQPKPVRVYLLDRLLFWPLFKVVGDFRGGAKQLYLVGRDRHTSQPFALGVPNGFIDMPMEACLRWTLNAHKGDKVIEV